MSTYDPVLEINQLTLTFNQTSVDKPCFQLLIVAQQHANTPVTIETDAPDYFQVATDSQPTFKPALTFVPSPEGSYVHVRYSSPKRTPVRARLMIHSPYDSQIVMLEGRATGMLAAVQTVVAGSQPLRLDDTSDDVPRKRWVAVVGIALISGLTYAGFRYKCELFPGLCKATADKKSGVYQTIEPAIDSAHNKTLPRPQSTSDNASASARSAKQRNRESRKGKKSQATKEGYSTKGARVVNRRKFDSTILTKESELERTLNRQPDSN